MHHHSRFALGLALTLTASLLYAGDPLKLFSVEVRSEHYRFNMSVVPLGDTESRCTPTATDVSSSQVFTLPAITVHQGTPAESTLDANGLHFRVGVNQLASSLNFSFGVTDDSGKEVDSLRGNWGPHEDTLAARYPLAFKVGDGVLAPIVVQRVEPSYTPEARNARIAGMVLLEVMIDEAGVVRDVAVLKKLPFGLTDAAEQAVRQWTFKPATTNGRPVMSLFNLTVSFKPGAPELAADQKSK